MVLVFGTICVDRIRRVPFLPGPGGYVEVTEEVELLGGEAANTANALVRWGADTLLCGNTLETTGAGAILRQDLAEKGIPQIEVPAEGQIPPSPVCDVYVTPDGDRTMFGVGFSKMDAGIDVEKVPYRAGAWFTAEPNMTKAAEAARLAAVAGMHTYLMDFVQEDAPVAPGSFWQCSTDWAGARGDEAANIAWVAEWVARYRCFAILTDGAQGLVAGSPEHPIRAYPAFPAGKVVDATGSGDVFRAGMLYGMDRGWEVQDCLRFASAAGCLQCQVLGGTGPTPTVGKIEGFIRKHDDVSRQFSQ